MFQAKLCFSFNLSQCSFELCWSYLEQSLSSCDVFTNKFIKTSLTCRGVDRTLFGSTKLSNMMFSQPGVRLSLEGGGACRFIVSTLPFRQRGWNFCVTRLLSQQHNLTFKSPLIINPCSLYLTFVRSNLPITVTARSKALNTISHLTCGIVGSNHNRGIDVCPRVFCVCVILCW
jgi:hypothetical protein